LKENKMSEKKEYLKAKVDGKMEIETNMKAENIAFVIGRLLIALEEKGLGTQEKIAFSILETNRLMNKFEK